VSKIEKFRQAVNAVLQYHEEKKAGTTSESYLKGQWIAFEATLWLYRDFEKRVYYYAMHGEKEYVKEFGNDKEGLKEVKEFVESCR